MELAQWLRSLVKATMLLDCSKFVQVSLSAKQQLAGIEAGLRI